MPMKAVGPEDLLKSRGVGYTMSDTNYALQFKERFPYELHRFTHNKHQILVCYQLRVPDEHHRECEVEQRDAPNEHRCRNNRHGSNDTRKTRSFDAALGLYSRRVNFRDVRVAPASSCQALISHRPTKSEA
jgi:hypothetical protein